MHTDKYGLLINVGVSLAIAVVSMLLGIIVARRQKGERVRAAGFAFTFYWISLALLYFFVALRTTAGYLGWQELDYIFFFVDNVFGGLLVAPPVFLLVYFLTSKRNLALGVSSIFIAVWLVWNIINISAGAANYTVEFWYTEWEPSSEIARLIAIFGLYVPGALAMLGMNLALLRARSKMARYRIPMTSLSFLIALSAIIVDYLRPGPPWLRLVILAAAIIGFFAYVPPRFLQSRLEMSTSTQ